VKKNFILLIILSTTLFADFNITDFDDTTNIIKKESKNFRKLTTKKYHRFLNMVDSYFANSNDINRSSYREIRKNRLEIILSLKDSSKLNLHLRGKIVLPQLKNRAELTFSQNDDQEIDNQSTTNENDDVISDSKLHVGLKYYLYREKKSTAYAKLSLKVRSPFGPYIKFGVDKSYMNNNFLETKFRNALYYYINGNDLSASTSISFFKPITDNYWIGEGNKLYWKGERSLYLKNSLILYQIFDLNNRISYKTEYTTSYDNIDKFNHDNFSLSAGYFHRFDRWFFIEVAPKFRKKRDNHYKNEKLITLNFGMLLGK
jgi:hypothetical protein